jgi:hypothetical protein
LHYGLLEFRLFKIRRIQILATSTNRLEVSMKGSVLVVGMLVLGLCFVVPALGQIPDAGFESWGIGSNAGILDPVGWITSNIPGFSNNVTRVTSAHGGSYAVRGEVSTLAGVNVPLPVLLTTAPMFPWNVRSASLTGYYQFFPAAGSTDSLYIITVFWSGAVVGVNAGGGVALGSTGASYKQFTIPIVYGVLQAPDSAMIEVYVGGASRSGSAASPGSYFLLDDLSFSGIAQATAVNDREPLTPNSFELQQNFPNPFNPSTTIRFSVPQTGHVSLKVYNVLGVEVASLVDEQKDAGTFSVHWNASGLPSGMYMYRLSVTSNEGLLFDESKKLVVLK